MPGGYVCSASLKGGTSDVKEAALGGRRISKRYSKEQREFYTAHAPDGLGLDDLPNRPPPPPTREARRERSRSADSPRSRERPDAAPPAQWERDRKAS